MGDEKHVRQRGKKGKQGGQSSPQATTRARPREDPRSPVRRKDSPPAPPASLVWTALSAVNTVIGLCVMGYAAYHYARYCNTINENRLWFSNIKEVEREISFRTEAGLYYSYYKQMVNATTLQEGVYELTHDNLTEHTVTMNVLQRMNIYQELILAVLYRTVPAIQTSLQPIYFYLYSIWALNGFLLCGLYLMSWSLTGTWLSGLLTIAFYVINKSVQSLLTIAFYVINKDDTTRVPYVAPLRESFALPYFWVQLFFITKYFNRKTSRWQERFYLFSIFKFTLGFSLFWQFNQFALLLQAMALFGVQVLHIVPHRKIRNIYLIHLLSLLCVCVLQFFNMMIITGPVYSFILAALVIMYIQGERPSSNGVILRIIKLLVYILLVFALMMSSLTLIKLVIPVDSDEHIYKFVLHKFGFAHYSDFDVNLYVCNGAFVFLSPETFHRMTMNYGVFPLYCVVQGVGLLCLLVGVIQKWRKESHSKKNEDQPQTSTPVLVKTSPELCYHLIQAVFFGAMGVMVLRMKYLWTPYICLLGAQALCHPGLYHWGFSKLGISSKLVLEFVRNGLLVAVVCGLIVMHKPVIDKELDDLREFYDPDTVELMHWINGNTAPKESFTGSMQLLAAVKLSTGRPITNHPHYEDKNLRHRTKELYAMYSKIAPEEVHAVMLRYNATYIILEDSICLSRKDNCALGTILDLDMGLVPDNPDHGAKVSGLVETRTPRFCDEVRKLSGAYGKLFRSVFKNNTFRIYKVLV